MIEITIAHDKQFNSLSEFAQLLYLKILPHTDDYGRFEGDPEILKARVDPLSKKKIQYYQKAIKEISDSGLWFIYQTDTNKQIIQYKPDTFERINAFLIKKRGNSEYPEYKDLYKVISGDITYKVISKKQKEESKKKKEEIEIINPLQKFINQYCENIKKLEQQLTNEESIRLLNDYSIDEIKIVIESMENYKQLSKKYSSVNLTMRNWLRRNRENGTNRDKNGRGTIDFSKWDKERATDPTSGTGMVAN